ncbi:MAG: single-stranded DNA-binding protein [Magnetococcus sp. DMHC-1]|nr:single-stranded DNA-binding protein [Magnetococcales bacterium]
MPDPVAPENQTILEGVLLEPVGVRLTPSGRPVATLELEHRSTVTDLLPLERCEVRIAVLAVGTLAEWCRNLPPGANLRVAGRLNQRRWIREGKTRWGRTELIAQRIESRPQASHATVQDSVANQSIKEIPHDGKE